MTWQERARELHFRSVDERWVMYGDEDKRFLTLALCGEVGELANLVKKEWRGDTNKLEMIHKELADAAIYLHLLIETFKCDLSTIAMEKLNEFEERLMP